MAIVAQLDRLSALPVDELLALRYARYRAMGSFSSAPPAAPVRPERQGIGDRLRTLFDIGRMSLGLPDGTALRPQAADEADDPPLREEV
jgi:hypothetical protein